MSHPVTRLMASLRGIQGPAVRRKPLPRVTASLEEPPAGSYEPLIPPQWWRNEQRTAQLERDYPEPSKLKMWWRRHDDVLLVVLICVVMVVVLAAVTVFLKKMGVE